MGDNDVYFDNAEKQIEPKSMKTVHFLLLPILRLQFSRLSLSKLDIFVPCVGRVLKSGERGLFLSASTRGEERRRERERCKS